VQQRARDPARRARPAAGGWPVRDIGGCQHSERAERSQPGRPQPAGDMFQPLARSCQGTNRRILVADMEGEIDQRPRLASRTQLQRSISA